MNDIPSPAALKVFLVDDSPLVRERLAALIAAISGVEIVGEAGDSDMAVSGLATCDADVAVVDLQLGETSGMDVLAALTRLDRRVVSIVLTNHSTKSVRDACLGLGADYFFDKTGEFHLALDAIEQLALSRASSPSISR
ncbi:response regulator transcription factor [Trinickia violacea]|uniref:Response regulator transcription factor n=1 Tax=Trinickia violacea TaxID=2571746 RepID=A0A4V1EHD4_9BURK|nr:response regulator transcription factor [Trinickia violacea]QCP49880.1 response regulator transcription factor [Trinickia violacea]